MDMQFFPTVTELEQNLPFYLTTAGHWDRQDHVRRPDGYDSYQWLQCSGGEGRLLLNGEEHIIKANQGFFLYPRVPHEYYPIASRWDIDWIAFGGTGWESFSKASGIAGSGVFMVTHPEAIILQIQSLLTLARSSSLINGLESSKIVYSILLDLMKYATSSNVTVQQQYTRLQPVLEYMARHYNESISLETLSATIGVTPQYLCNLFKAAIKMRPFEYLNTLRVNQGKKIMVEESGVKISELAERLGYESASYFCAVFKRIAGISPERFRKTHALY